MQVQTIKRMQVRVRAGAAAGCAALIAGAAALAACGTSGVAAATHAAAEHAASANAAEVHAAEVHAAEARAAEAHAGAAGAGTTLTYYAFDVNNGAGDPGFVPVPGSNPKVFAQGDELIINDQLTSTHKVSGGYPIVGRDAGACTLTRIPEPRANQTLANCVVTAVSRNGSLTIQGGVSFRSQRPEPAVLAVTGGTGRFDGASGTVAVSYTKDFKILTIRLR